MIQQPRSIADHIDCLARLTGAPVAFIDQVRTLFLSKGISLDAEADPFIAALDEAFRREESIRTTTYRARDNLDRMQSKFRKIGRAYVEHVARNVSGEQRPKSRLRTARASTQVTIRGDHRTLVTRTEREELPMVPGPEEIQ
jgi:hypothetical protein